MKCLLFAFVGFLAASASAQVDYNEVAKAIFKDFVIGPVDVGDVTEYHFDYNGKTVNYNITNAVIEKINSVQLDVFEPVTDGYRLKKLPRVDEDGHLEPVQSLDNLHTMKVALTLGELTINSKLFYQKTGESVKEVDLKSTTNEEYRWSRVVETTLIFDAVKRVVLGYEHVFTLITAYDSISNCKDTETGFCDALHDFLQDHISWWTIAQKLGAEVKRMLIGRRF